MRDFSKIAWQDFYLSDFFKFEKGNQNNMASLTSGDIPLVSARKVDNGFKDFVAPNNKKLFDGGIITLNIDGDGGAGIAYYQPYKMALDSHVAALIPKIDLNRYQLIFIAACITKQRNRFGHGYSINSNRLRSFKLMLPIIEGGEIPDWEFMNDFQKAKEQEILKPTIDTLCKRLIINEITGGVNHSVQIGKYSFSPKYLPKSKEVNALKKQTTQKGIPLMCPQQRLTMVLMASSGMKAA